MEVRKEEGGALVEWSTSKCTWPRGSPTTLDLWCNIKVVRATPLPSACSHPGEKTGYNSKQHLLRTNPYAVDFVQWS